MVHSLDRELNSYYLFIVKVKCPFAVTLVD